MTRTTRWRGAMLLLASLATAAGEVVGQEVPTVTAVTDDGVTIYGEPYFGTLDESAPLILLFHQGGSNGRGEYGELSAWLNQAGYRAIAWDQRSGGDTYGGENRTVRDLDASAASGFCAAYADLQAALDYSDGLARTVVVMGSSYSAALVVRLAAENPDRVAAVVAFSPASGGPMSGCRARDRVEEVVAPMLVFRPRSEMASDAALEQRGIFERAGADFRIAENGVHGASMLSDARTGHDMSAVRAQVILWLEDHRVR